MYAIEAKKGLDVAALAHRFFSIIPGMERAGTVPVVNADTLQMDEFMKKWVYANKACLVKGAVKHWPAVRKWKNKDYWKAIGEDNEVIVYPHQNYNSSDLQVGDRMPYHQAIERLYESDDEVVSIPSEAIVEGGRFADALKDMSGFRFMPVAPPPKMYDRQRLFSYRCAATAWHYHNIDETLMCQVNGSKKVALLAPDIPKARKVTAFLNNELHLKGESLDAALKLQPMIVDVEEGDALYIPPYWFHGVVPNDDKVGFTLAYCWGSPWHKFGMLNNYFVRQLYKAAMWPFKPISVVMPLVALYSSIQYLLYRIRK